MSRLQFHKYQGTGNDFVMIDDRDHRFFDQCLAMEGTPELVSALCHRKFGIGADGLILIRNHPDADFEMVYYNADGSQSMCGNGSRCAVRFARSLGIIDTTTHFLTIDGMHEATVDNDVVRLKMADVKMVKFAGDDFFIHTGSPHHVVFYEDVRSLDVYKKGREIRYSQKYAAEGTNVNFAEVLGNNKVFVRTYERGVEDETLSCGTGVTAVALACSYKKMTSPVTIHTLGGILTVSYEKEADNAFTGVYLSGPAEEVFRGEIDIR